VLAGLAVTRIRYFTAWANPPFPGKVDRRRVYLRALATVPHLSVHLGRGIIEDRIVQTVGTNPKPVRVHIPRHKGVDVALADFLRSGLTHTGVGSMPPLPLGRRHPAGRWSRSPLRA